MKHNAPERVGESMKRIHDCVTAFALFVSIGAEAYSKFINFSKSINTKDITVNQDINYFPVYFVGIGLISKKLEYNFTCEYKTSIKYLQ